MRLYCVFWLYVTAFMPVVLPAQAFIAVEGGGMTVNLFTDEKEYLRDFWVDDFQIADTEVTVAQWRKFTIDTGMEFPWEGHYFGDITELSPYRNSPIQLVRIEEVVAYCNWRSQREGFQPVYLQKGNRIIRDTDADGYRLPTTAEWDFAARGGRHSRGYVYAGSNNAEEVGWVNRPFEEGTHPVATKAPNELGLYDMTGNIREWTWPDIGIPFPTSGVEEVLHLRGGNWTSTFEHAKLGYDRDAWVFQWACIGFRLARNAE